MQQSEYERKKMDAILNYEFKVSNLRFQISNNFEFQVSTFKFWIFNFKF